MAGEWVVLAVLRRARGLRGELTAESLGSEVERFTPGLRVWLDGERPLEIERAWDHNGRLVLKFAGIDSRTDAESLQGRDIRIPEEERPPAPEGQHYLSDLIGCRVETAAGRVVGEVTAWYDYGGPALLEVGGEGGPMIPLVPEICLEVDEKAKRIVVELPEGLEELNRG